MAGRVTRRRLAAELVRMLGEHPEHRNELVRQTAAFLLDTKQARAAHLLMNDVANEVHRREGRLSAEVSAAYELDATTRQKITDMLIHATGATSVELQVRVVPDLIGGIIVRTPQYQLDASVATRLKQIAQGV